MNALSKTMQKISPLVWLAFWLAVMGRAARADSVDDFAREQMRQQHIPGLCLSVVHNGKVVKLKGYGLADVEQNVSVTPATVFEIGSVTKQFTAVAVLMLVDQGKVNLDAPLGIYLASPPPAWKSITVRQLMNQTSGIKDYLDAAPANTLVLFAASSEVIKTIKDEPLLFTPGERWSYSNTNYFLLGQIIESVSGKSYADFLNERLFTNLHMTNTGLNDRKAIVPNRARGYAWDWGKNELKNAGSVDPSWAYAAGGLRSTGSDLAKWYQALDGTTLLQERSKSQLWTAGRLSDGTTHRYGFGWYIDRVNGYRSISHGGDIPGFATYTVSFPDDHLSVTVCVNQSIYPKRIADTIATRYLPALIYRPIPDSDPEFAELVARLYQIRADGKSEQWKQRLFAPALWKSLQSSLTDENETAFYKRLGVPKSVRLVERRRELGGQLSRFRIMYQNNSRIASFLRVQDGIILEWNDYEE